MYQLMVSYDCGIHYSPDKEAESLDAFKPRMDELDDQMFRWYVTKDGEIYFGEDGELACKIYKIIRKTRERVNANRPKSGLKE